MSEIHTHPVKKLKLEDIDRATYNPRSIDDEAKQGLRESLQMFGVMDMPVVNQTKDGYVLVGGHQRLDALAAEGVTYADCLVVEYDIETEKMANIALNNPATQGEFDVTKANSLLPKITADLPGGVATAGFGHLLDDIQSQAKKLAVGAAEAKDAPEKGTASSKSNAKPKSKAGKTYALGEHRLYCGSCFDGIAILLKGKQAKACLTDPPYNIDYHGSDGTKIDNDSMDDDSWQRFMDQVAETIVSRTEGACFVFMSSKEMPSLQRAWEKAGGVLHRWLWWVKDRFSLTRSDFHHQHEPCLYGARSGVNLEHAGKPRTSILEFPKPKANDLHPTMKPVDLFRHLMEDCTDVGDTVIEPFAGSGTTLVVAEELQRVCLATEMDPVFCDRIRQRWWTMVNGTDKGWMKGTPEVAP